MTRDQIIIKLMEIYVSHRAVGTMVVAPEIWRILKQDDDPSQPTWLFRLPIGVPVVSSPRSFFLDGKADIYMVTRTSPGESAKLPEDFDHYKDNLGEYDDC